ncbi:PTS lactose/cellobiose transporter subunit IIA [Pectinatus brassicae]|uniref:PTS system cellobiose-specific IIA component n=1 Tax=Pectinatus brassicae TaxID=862415 RepID=A0A840US77_9FIRM|nr:PTS lactose/cellobiose transporter subunit IIA [Pectinatus brassicae]MBB5335385.1 PTS system cellobiose-specific IIA component [Pectinatus brassicae]
MENLDQIAYSMIAGAGDAQALQFKALEDVKKADFAAAEKKLQEADELLIKAHQLQTNLIKNEANGEKHEYSVLLVHAQDYVSSTVLNKKIVEQMIDIYKELRQ